MERRQMLLKVVVQSKRRWAEDGDSRRLTETSVVSSRGCDGGAVAWVDFWVLAGHAGCRLLFCRTDKG